MSVRGHLQTDTRQIFFFSSGPILPLMWWKIPFKSALHNNRQLLLSHHILSYFYLFTHSVSFAVLFLSRIMFKEHVKQKLLHIYNTLKIDLIMASPWRKVMFMAMIFNVLLKRTNVKKVAVFALARAASELT